MALLTKIRTFLLQDTSGAVTSDWTVLTAMLTAASISTMGTFSVGVHVIAHAIQTDITIAAPSDGTTGESGSSIAG